MNMMMMMMMMMNVIPNKEFLTPLNVAVPLSNHCRMWQSNQWIRWAVHLPPSTPNFVTAKFFTFPKELQVSKLEVCHPRCACKLISMRTVKNTSLYIRFDIFPRCNFTQFISGKLLYMFRAVSSPIIRSRCNCIYSIWYLLTITAICLYCGRVGAGLSVVWEL